jgi:very-short-patch-repair endonuclease
MWLMELSDHVLEVPETLAFVLHGVGKGHRKTRTSICQECGENYKHSCYWTYQNCPDCVAKEMDKENIVSFHFARQLNLNEFKVFRRYGRPQIRCSWECKQCGDTLYEDLSQMRHKKPEQLLCVSCSNINRFTNVTKDVTALAQALSININAVLQHSINGFTIQFYCPECGQNSERPFRELKLGRGCSCKAKISFGESAVQAYLKLNGIKFVREYPLSRLGFSANLRFDFYIEDKQLAIEYDGIQHFKLVAIFGGEDGFMKRQENDNLKDELATNAGIRVIRIPYDCQDIFLFLDQELKTEPERC